MTQNVEIIITVKNDEQKQKILDVLEYAEQEGTLDFTFGVRSEW